MEYLGTSTDSKIRMSALIKGLILGAVVLAATILNFYFITKLATGVGILIGPFVFSFVLPLLLAILFTLALRKSIGGYWNFRQAVTGIFIMFLLSYAVQTIGRDLIFAKVIEPQMVQKTEDAMLKASAAMYQKSGLDAASAAKKTGELKAEMEAQKNQTFGSLATAVAVTVILLFVVSVIFGAIFKKELLLASEAQDFPGQ